MLFCSTFCGRSFSQVVSITNDSSQPIVVYGNWDVLQSEESTISFMLRCAKFRKIEANSTINDTIRWESWGRDWEPWTGKIGYLFVKDTIDVEYSIEDVISGNIPYQLFDYTYDELKELDSKIIYTDDGINSSK